jgi:hypothetical protein
LDGAPPKPQRGRIIHFYSQFYYETRVKHRVEARLEAMKRRHDVSGEVMAEKIDIIAKVTGEVWDKETPVFQHGCQMDCEREYEQRLKAWEVSLNDSPTRTPEELAA